MKVFTLAIYPYLIKQYQSAFSEIMKEYHLTQIEIDVLAFLANNPEYKHAQDIVDIRGISKGHASVAIEKLVQKNYLIREPDPNNRRCNILMITPDAKEVIMKIQDIQSQHTKKAYQGFTDEEKEIYQKLLRKMYLNLKGEMR